jgi:ribose 5-phosphate isomerase A
VDVVDGKERAGIWAAEQVTDGMTVGLGTGSTAAFFIRALAKRIRGEKLKIRMASSSFSTVLLAEELGLSLLPLDEVDRLDLYVDGADEVDPQQRLIKGRGAAMVREKILAHVATRFLVIVEPIKCVERLGVRFPVPVEVLPFAHKLARRELTGLGASSVNLRLATEKDGPIITDQGNFVLDARFPKSVDVAALEPFLDSIPGVVGHGLFARYAKRITVAIGLATSVEVVP